MDPEHWTVRLLHWKKVNKFPVPSRDVTNQTFPGRELLNYSSPGRVWLVASWLGTVNSLTFYYSVQKHCHEYPFSSLCFLLIMFFCCTPAFPWIISCFLFLVDLRPMTQVGSRRMCLDPDVVPPLAGFCLYADLGDFHHVLSVPSVCIFETDHCFWSIDHSKDHVPSFHNSAREKISSCFQLGWMTPKMNYY